MSIVRVARLFALAAGTLLVVALAAVTAAPVKTAFAHGRPPFLGDLQFHPTDPNVIVARGTWGLALSEDSGESWRWSCAAAFGADPLREDPPLRIMADGALLIGTFDGLSRSNPTRCDYSYPSSALEDQFVIDLDHRASAPDTVYAVVTSGGAPDQLYRSDDAGSSFRAAGPPIAEVLLERVRVAPGDGARVYLSGADPSGDDGMRHAFFFRSDDGGETFDATEVPLLEGERNLHLLAVDPTDADRALARVTRRVIDSSAERVLLTEDGGRSFRAVAEVRDVTDAAFEPGGQTAWLTSRRVEGLYVSDDAGRTFTQLVDGSLLCVEVRDGEIWLCHDELLDGRSLSVSRDDAETFDEALRFSQLYELPDCPACSQVGYVCPEWFPDLAADLRLDGGASFDGSTGAPRDAAPPEFCDIDAGRHAADAGPAAADGAASMDAGRVTSSDAAGAPDAGAAASGSGCGCRVAGHDPPRRALALWLAATTWFGRRRARRAPEAS